MIDREAEISRLYADLNSGSKFLSKRSIFALAEALDEAEPIIGVLSCMYGSWSGALATTDRQLVFMQKPLVGRKTIEKFPFDLITSVEQRSFLGLAELTIHSGGKSAKVKQIDNSDLTPFMKAFETARASGARGLSESNTVGEMERLVSLMEKGHLTAEEFACAKRKLLV